MQQVNGRLRLRFEQTPGASRTILVECEQQLPLKVVRAFAHDDGAALIHLHNLSGGVLGGDRLELQVEAQQATRVQLTSTGATRVYRSRDDAALATQTTRILAAEDSLVEYLPDQLIPFKGARYKQETLIELRHGAGLFWWEVVAPGRRARGEVHAYELLQLKTEIIAEEQLIALERSRLEPAKRLLTSTARLGAYNYLATFYVCRAGVEAARWLRLEAELNCLAQELSVPGEAVWGVSTLVAHGVVVRGLSVSGRDIERNLKLFWRAAKLYLYNREAIPPRKIY